MRGQAIALAAIALLCLAAGAVIASRGSIGAAVAGSIFILVPAICAVRASLSALVVDEDGLRARNVFGTATLGWGEVSGFEMGRKGLLGCILLIHRKQGGDVAVFAVQGITGQPRRKSSLAAAEIAEELNRRLDATQASSIPAT